MRNSVNPAIWMLGQLFSHRRKKAVVWGWSVSQWTVLTGWSGAAPVEVGVGWALNVQGAAADVVDGLVVEHDRHVCVLQQGVRRQHTVVGLHDSSGHLRRVPLSLKIRMT